MYLMYLDDSGSVANSDETHLVLAGLIVHEERLFFIKDKLDKLANDLFGDNGDSTEFHCSEIYSGRRPPWDALNRERKKQTITQILEVAATQCDVPAGQKLTTLVACAVKKADYPGQDAMELAFEDLCSRFQHFLRRQYHQTNQRVKGLIILDESSYETSLQKLAREFIRYGNRWGLRTEDILEVPLFVNSKASRGIQLADAVAYAVFRRYSQNDLSYFETIAHCFDSVDFQIHGLCHKTANHLCQCPACLSRRLTSRPGDLT